MKRVAIADIHLSAYKDDPICESGLPERLDSLIKALRVVSDFAINNSIKYVDILGDLYNDKNVIYTDSQNAFCRLLDSYPNLIFTIISGNHDLSSTGKFQTSCIEALKGISNVVVVDKATKIEENIIAVPYDNDMVTRIKESSDSDILLSHFGLSEAVLQSGISIKCSLGMKDLAKFKLVLLGHYHKPQQIKSNSTNLYYVGSPIHINWNDKNEQKRFLVYDTDSLDVVSIPLKNIGKEFREFKLDDSDKVSTILEEATKLRELGNHVRVRKLISEDIESKDLNIIDDTETDILQRGLTVTMTTKEKAERYMEIKNVPESKKPDYLKVGLKLMSSKIKE